MLLPSTASNPASMIAQALTMYKSLVTNGPSRDHQETQALNETDLEELEDLDEKHISEGSNNRSGSTSFDTEKPGHTGATRFSLQDRNKDPR